MGACCLVLLFPPLFSSPLPSSVSFSMYICTHLSLSLLPLPSPSNPRFHIISHDHFLFPSFFIPSLSPFLFSSFLNSTLPPLLPLSISPSLPPFLFTMHLSYFLFSILFPFLLLFRLLSFPSPSFLSFLPPFVLPSHLFPFTIPLPYQRLVFKKKISSRGNVEISAASAPLITAWSCTSRETENLPLPILIGGLYCSGWRSSVLIGGELS